MFRPKGSMCIACKNSKSNKCYLLDFSKMKILIKNDGDGYAVVKCTSYIPKLKKIVDLLY